MPNNLSNKIKKDASVVMPDITFLIVIKSYI